MSRQTRRGQWGSASLVLASVRRRKSKLLLASVALAVGGMLMSGLLTIYRGVSTNLSSQFRQYGPNVFVTRSDGGLLPSAEASRIQRLIGNRDRSAGVLYATVHASSPSEQALPVPAILAGASLTQLRDLNPAWRLLPANPRTQAGLWLGNRAARTLHVRVGDRLTLRFGAQQQTLPVLALVSSGGSVDSQILAPSQVARSLTGLSGYTNLELQIGGEPAAIQATVRRLRRALPTLRISPLRQITETEGHIVLNTRGMLVAATALILLTIALCVSAALTSMAMERRKDFAVMKALGAGEGQIFAAFVSEGALLGLAGGLAGSAAGALIALFIGEAVFGVALHPSVGLLVETSAATMILSSLAALTPWPLLQRISPATILKGE